MIMMLWKTRTSKYPHKSKQDETTSSRAPGHTSSCLQDLFSSFPANIEVLTQNMGSNFHHHFHLHLGHGHLRGLNKYLGALLQPCLSRPVLLRCSWAEGAKVGASTFLVE